MRICWLFLACFILLPAVGTADTLSDALEKVQADHDLQLHESTVVADRDWTSQSSRDSLRQYIRARQALGRDETVAAYGLLADAISFDPDNAAAWRQLAFLRERENQFEQARKAWEKVHQVDPGDPDALYALGMSAAQRGQIEETVRLLLPWELSDRRNRFDRMQPFRGVHVATRLAAALDRMGETEAATLLRDSARSDIDALVQGAAGYQIDLGSWLRFVEILQRERSYETAFDVLALLIPTSVVQERQRIDMLVLAIGMAIAFDDGQHTSALIHDLHRREMLNVEGAVNGQANLAMSLDEAAAIFSRFGNINAAAWLYQDVIEVDPAAVMARNNVAYFMLEDGRIDPATERLLESAWRAAPEDASVLDSYGWMQYLKGRFEDDDRGPGAVQLLDQANRLAGDVPSVEILDHLGDARYRMGDSAGAVEAWTQALAILDNTQVRMDQIRQLETTQQTLWGWWGQRIVNPRDVYDLQFGPLEERLRAKLEAIASGESPAVRRTFEEQAGD